MATASFSPEPRSSFRRRVAISFVVLVVLVGLTAATIAWLFHRTAVASLPQLDGAIKVAGLSAPVTVVRDTMPLSRSCSRMMVLLPLSRSVMRLVPSGDHCVGWCAIFVTAPLAGSIW